MTEETIELTTAIADRIFQRLENQFRVMPALTLQEAAAEMGISTETLRKLCDAKEIPHIRVGKFYRIKPRDINEYLERNYIK
jgi:excisionase family DNA binding protein